MSEIPWTVIDVTIVMKDSSSIEGFVKQLRQCGFKCELAYGDGSVIILVEKIDQKSNLKLTEGK